MRFHSYLSVVILASVLPPSFVHRLLAFCVTAVRLDIDECSTLVNMKAIDAERKAFLSAFWQLTHIKFALFPM